MGLLWEGKYKFEDGDVVRIREGHPFAGVMAVVTAVYDRQFEVTSKEIPDGKMWLWEDDLELISTHRTQVPEIFEY